jgi:GH15 family glucan-1,4-alpha-glucosidase
MQDLFSRSLALIRAHQAPEGAYVAGPTFPNYRYCWFRDGTYIAYAMDLAGAHDSARRFYDWAAARIVERRAQIDRVAQAPPGQAPRPEDLLHTRYTLDGQAAADEWPNFQLDGFGTLLWGIAQHLALTGGGLPDGWRAAVDLPARYLAALWRRPCYDCWEEFGDQVHTATLAAIYGGLTAAAALLGGDGEAAAQEAAAIRAFVRDHCIVAGSLCKFVDNPAVDGSLITAATPYRLLAPDDPVMQTTAARIEAELRVDGGGVHRYAQDSYYGGGEWLLLTAYLGWYYVERGERTRAAALLDWVAGRAVGAEQWLPEQVADHLNDPDMLPVWEARWGASACPLLWSHAAYLTLAAHLAAPPALPAGRAVASRE